MCTGNTLAGAQGAAAQVQGDGFATGPTSREGADPRYAATIGLFSGAAAGFAEFTAGQQAGKFLHENAQISRKQAKLVRAAGEEQIGGINRQARATTGAQRASFAGQGVDVGTGSAADIQAETAELAGEDVARVRNRAALEAYGFRRQAFFQEQAATNARKAGAFKGASTLLGAANQSGKFG